MRLCVSLERVRTGLALEEKEPLGAAVVGVNITVLPGDDSSCCPFLHLGIRRLFLLCSLGAVFQLQSLKLFFHSVGRSLFGVSGLCDARKNEMEEEDLIYSHQGYKQTLKHAYWWRVFITRHISELSYLQGEASSFFHSSTSSLENTTAAMDTHPLTLPEIVFRIGCTSRSGPLSHPITPSAIITHTFEPDNLAVIAVHRLFRSTLEPLLWTVYSVHDSHPRGLCATTQPTQCPSSYLAATIPSHRTLRR